MRTPEAGASGSEGTHAGLPPVTIAAVQALTE